MTVWPMVLAMSLHSLKGSSVACSRRSCQLIRTPIRHCASPADGEIKAEIAPSEGLKRACALLMDAEKWTHAPFSSVDEDFASLFKCTAVVCVFMLLLLECA